MTNPDIKWKEVNYWEHQFVSTIAWPINVFMAILLTTVFFGVLLDTVILLYTGFIMALISFIALLAGGIYRSKLAPQRAGYSPSEFHVEYRNNKKIIPFNEIEEIYSYHHVGGGLVIQKSEDRPVYYGPGLGGGYGKSVLTTYIQWLEKNENKKAKIREKKVLFYKLYEVVIE